jgi:hypothetical protein
MKYFRIEYNEEKWRDDDDYQVDQILTLEAEKDGEKTLVQ